MSSSAYRARALCSSLPSTSRPNGCSLPTLYPRVGCVARMPVDVLFLRRVQRSRTGVRALRSESEPEFDLAGAVQGHEGELPVRPLHRRNINGMRYRPLVDSETRTPIPTLDQQLTSEPTAAASPFYLRSRASPLRVYGLPSPSVLSLLLPTLDSISDVRRLSGGRCDGLLAH